MPRFLISYVMPAPDGGIGFGSVEMELPRPFGNGDAGAVSRDLAERNNRDWAVVLNVVRLPVGDDGGKGVADARVADRG